MSAASAEIHRCATCGGFLSIRTKNTIDPIDETQETPFWYCRKCGGPAVEA